MEGVDLESLSNEQWLEIRAKYLTDEDPITRARLEQIFLSLSISSKIKKLESLILSQQRKQDKLAVQTILAFFKEFAQDTDINLNSFFMSLDTITKQTLLQIVENIAKMPDDRLYDLKIILFNLLTNEELTWSLTNTPKQILRMLETMTTVNTVVVYSCPDFPGEFTNKAQTRWKYDLSGNVGKTIGFMGNKTVQTLVEIIPTLKGNSPLRKLVLVLPSYECPEGQDQEDYINNITQTGNLIKAQLQSELWGPNEVEVEFKQSAELYSNNDLIKLKENLYIQDLIFQKITQNPELSKLYAEVVALRGQAGYGDPSQQIVSYVAEGILLDQSFKSQESVYGNTMYITTESPLIPSLTITIQELLGYASLPTCIITTKAQNY